MEQDLIQVEVAVQVDAGLEQPITVDRWIQWIQQWLLQLQPDLSPWGAYEVTLRLTRDADIQDLNGTYRDRDQPTDVLSFATIDEDPPTPAMVWETVPFYLGDIIISVETARRQAEERQHDLAIELAWLAAHGLLHLLGWDHPDEASLTAMLAQQDILLAAIAMPVVQ